MAQQERSVRTRRAVLEAAAEVFAERGYAAATVADILTRAGVTKGALYFHFDSKEDLAEGVLGEQTAQELVPQGLKLQEWVDSGMVLAYRLPRDAVLRAGARLSTDRRGRELYGSAFPLWVDFSISLLTEAQERGEVLPHVNPRETAEMMVGAFHGVQLFSQLTTDWQDVEVRVSTLFRHVLPTISAPALLSGLDTAPDRGARVTAELESRRVSTTASAG
ncbi:ScbR family autoregulator-binding transcription factor [Streptomyces sp. PU-14G]|uniref:ScbR family autoregulator-binding transcription factor n=1 Tax=Streptomyces sp. PU-14G TaxID=2800808 RepID=UPI0034DF9C4C